MTTGTPHPQGDAALGNVSSSGVERRLVLWGWGTTVWLIDNCMAASGLAGIWHKSSYSNPCGSCVEVTPLADGRIAVRHSRHPSGPVLICPRAEMAAFLHSTRVGQFGDRSTAPEIDSAGPTMPMPPSRPPR